MKIIWCLMGIGLLLLSAARDASSYTTCPVPAEVPLNRICTTICSSNADCAEAGSLCCLSAKCEQQCAHSITIPHPRPILGCPIPDPEMAGTCQEDCSDCVKEQMCCSNGCGHVCTTLVEVTPICQAILDAHNGTQMPGEFLPRCDENGDFTTMQCHSSTGYCWCVDHESGEPLGGVVKDDEPQCSCVDNNGTFYSFGEQFAVDCNTCFCGEGGNVVCTKMECSDPSDVLSVYYSCPVTEGLAGICAEECSNDSDCNTPQKCCYNSCGHTCTDPTPIPYIAPPLECPDFSNEPVICDIRECNDSTDCADGRLCCQNPCGSLVCSPGSPPPYPCTATVNSMNGALLGGFVPKCGNGDGTFLALQCFSHYCWCVQSDTGVPVSNMVLSSEVGYLECSQCIDDGTMFKHEAVVESDSCITRVCRRGEIETTNLCDSGTCWHDGKEYQNKQRLDDDCACMCLHGLIACASGDPCNDGSENPSFPSSILGAEPVWWHYLLVGCGVLIAVLVLLTVGLFIIMLLLRRHNRFRHKRLQESPSDTFEPEPAIVFKNGPLEAQSVELNVPLEDSEPVDT